MFSDSSNLGSTVYFSKSRIFTKTEEFSYSSFYSNSDEFSLSIHFSPSKTLILKNIIKVDINSDQTNNISTGMKIGIGVACGVAVLGLVVVGLFLLRRRKLNNIDLEEETVEIAEDITSSTVNQNPLVNFMSKDDPFMDEFE